MHGRGSGRNSVQSFLSDGRAVRNLWKRSLARNKRIALAALTNLSCVGGLPFASILCPSDHKMVFTQPRPKADIEGTEILQCSGPLPRCSVLSFRSDETRPLQLRERR